MQDYKTEDTVVLLDTSRSMLRKDFKPRRLSVAAKAINNFVNTKFSIDQKDRIALVIFGKITKKLSKFSYNGDSVTEALSKIKISGKGKIHEGIAFSLQLLVSEMRKLGGRVHRIFIISDNKLNYESKELDKMLKIAKGLGIFIDTCQLGKTQDYKTSTLKKIADKTSGEYGYFTNTKAILTAGEAFASKKNLQSTEDYFSQSEQQEIPPLVKGIALELRRPTVMEIREMMRAKSKEKQKCQICHMSKSPITNADFYTEGRFCPQCDRPMHLSCAAGWAKKSEYDKHVLRCPFCYFLIEIPKSALKLLNKSKSRKTKENGQKIQIIDEDQVDTTKMRRIPENKLDEINASCVYCRSIFLGEYKVFQCENCGVYYHEPCLQEVYKEVRACRKCGRKISFENE
ncbi:MAG: VWA domain-containing protein [Promethearchaeia archaeon]